MSPAGLGLLFLCEKTRRQILSSRRVVRQLLKVELRVKLLRLTQCAKDYQARFELQKRDQWRDLGFVLEPVRPLFRRRRVRCGVGGLRWHADRESTEQLVCLL